MQDLPLPLKAALTAGAIVWPFMAGLGVVVWSKFRTRNTSTPHAGPGSLPG